MAGDNNSPLVFSRTSTQLINRKKIQTHYDFVHSNYVANKDFFDKMSNILNRLATGGKVNKLEFYVIDNVSISESFDIWDQLKASGIIDGKGIISETADLDTVPLGLDAKYAAQTPAIRLLLKENSSKEIRFDNGETIDPSEINGLVALQFKMTELETEKDTMKGPSTLGLKTENQMWKTM